MSISRPNSDISIGQWTDQSSGTIDIYTSIDESATSFSDWIQVVSAPLAGDPDLPSIYGLSTPPTLGAGEQFIMFMYADCSGLTSASMRWELLDGATVKSTQDITITNDVTIPLFTQLVDASVTSLSTPRVRFTLLHNGSEFRVDVYQFYLSAAFPHLSISAGVSAPQMKSPATGGYLSIASGGAHKLNTGIEDVNSSLIIGSGGAYKIHG